MKKILQYLLITFILGLFIVYMVIKADGLAPEEKFLIVGIAMSQHLVAIIWFMTLHKAVKAALGTLGAFVMKLLGTFGQKVGGIHYLGPVNNRSSTIVNSNGYKRVGTFRVDALKLRKNLIKVKSFEDYLVLLKHFLHKGHFYGTEVSINFDPVRSLGRSERTMNSNILYINGFRVNNEAVCRSADDQRSYYPYLLEDHLRIINQSRYSPDLEYHLRL